VGTAAVEPVVAIAAPLIDLDQCNKKISNRNRIDLVAAFYSLSKTSVTVASISSEWLHSKSLPTTSYGTVSHPHPQIEPLKKASPQGTA
jgi:hypothetical protein